MKEPIKKYMVEYYDTAYPSGGGYWRIDAYSNIDEAVSNFLKHRIDNSRFYALSLVPVKINYVNKLKKFIFNIKFPKSIEIS